MVIFHSYVNVYQRVEHFENWHTVNHSDLCGDGCCFYMLLPPSCVRWFTFTHLTIAISSIDPTVDRDICR